MSAQPTIPSGTTIGPYTLLQPLGTGATAVVYSAETPSGQTVALKVRLKQGDTQDRRFLREFESMRLLKVPGVVGVHRAGFHGEYLWFSMDRVFGQPFSKPLHAESYLIARVERAVGLGGRLARILGQLHDAGFVHRDVKPSNVLVDTGGNVHVLDFGIGTYFDDAEISQKGVVLGTVPYMAPEQLAGLSSNHKVDSFALGLMLWEGVAGERKAPPTQLGWIPKLILESLPPLASVLQEVPRSLSNLVERLLAVDPDDRPSCMDAAAELARIERGRESGSWPKPQLPKFEDVVNRAATVVEGRGEPVCGLIGISGSGRTVVAEHLHRKCLIQGRWPIHLRCRTDRVGKPLLRLVEHILDGFDEPVAEQIVGDAASILVRTWPHLPLQPKGDRPENAIDSLTKMVLRLTKHHPLLIVIHHLEQVDTLTSAWLEALAKVAGPKLGMLIMHEPRWATTRSQSLINRLAQCSLLQMTNLCERDAETVVTSLCPGTGVEFAANLSYADAVTAGWRALARWRNEPFEPAPAHSWPLALVHKGVPLSVYKRVVGDLPIGAWASESRSMVRLASRSAAKLAATQLGSRAQGAAALVRAWLVEPDAANHTRSIGALWLIAGEPGRAYLPLAMAAIDYEELGQFLKARKLLLLLDSLGEPKDVHQRVQFALKKTRASIALRTDLRNPIKPLLDAAKAAARSDDERGQVSLLQAQEQLRSGKTTSALVNALKVSSRPSMERLTQINALFTAIRARIQLNQLTEARREIERVKSLSKNTANPILLCRAGNAEASVALMQGDLQASERLCQQTITRSRAIGYRRGKAYSSHRLGQLLRMQGHRRRAESFARGAQIAAENTGDLVLSAESGLALATLLAERSDTLGARRTLDATTRRIRDMSMEHLLPHAMTIALYLGVITQELPDIQLALAALENTAHAEETAAVLVQHWRLQGDYDRALQVNTIADDNSFASCRFYLERARVLTQLKRPVEARAGASRVARISSKRGFHELLLFAELIGAQGDWPALQRSAGQSAWSDLFLGAIEFDARRLADSDPVASRARWQALAARADELGYQPAVDEARGWLV